MTKKESCFEDIMLRCKQGYLDYSFWHINGGNLYIEYFEASHFVGAIEYHFEENGVYLDMIEIPEFCRRQGYGKKIIDSMREDVDYIKCVPKDDDVTSFYEK